MCELIIVEFINIMNDISYNSKLKMSITLI